MTDALLDEAHMPQPPTQPAVDFHPFARSNPAASSRHAHFAFTLCDTHTEVLLTSHTSHLLVLVTQTAKLGSVLTASLDSTHLSLHSDVEPTFLVQTQLGSRPSVEVATGGAQATSPLAVLPQLYALLARQLIAQLVRSTGEAGPEGERKVVLCVSLKVECVQRAATEIGQGCSLQMAGMAVVRTLVERIKEADVW